jgi:hypothetical protein
MTGSNIIELEPGYLRTLARRYAGLAEGMM